MNPRPIDDFFENKLFLDGGFTYDPNFGFMSNTEASRAHFGRYIVGIESKHILSGSIGYKQARDIMRYAVNNNVLIGAWRDEETGLTHWDIVVAHDKLKDALEHGESLKQIAIYDSLEQKEIRV